jgi:hypothetical protein
MASVWKLHSRPLERTHENLYRYLRRWDLYLRKSKCPCGAGVADMPMAMELIVQPKKDIGSVGITLFGRQWN